MRLKKLLAESLLENEVTRKPVSSDNAKAEGEYVATDFSEDERSGVARCRCAGRTCAALGARRGRRPRRGTGRTAGAGRGARPRARDDACRSRGARAVVRGDPKPARQFYRGNGRRRLPRAAADGDRVAGAGRRTLDRRPHQAGDPQPARSAPHGGPVVQRQHPADQRCVHGPSGR